MGASTLRSWKTARNSRTRRYFTGTRALCGEVPRILSEYAVAPDTCHCAGDSRHQQDSAPYGRASARPWRISA